MPPAKLQSLLERAVTHHQAGRLAEADRLYTKICATAQKISAVSRENCREEKIS
jgi:hypothetical protein